MTAGSFFVQAVGLIPSVICFTSLQSGSRRRILFLQLLCCVMWTAHYALLGAATGVLTNLLGFLRVLVCTCKERRPWARSRLWLAFFLTCYALSPFLTWDGPYCLLLGAAMMMTTVALWVENMRLTRLLYLCNSPLMLLYNLIAGSWSCSIIESFALCSFLIAVWRFDLRPARQSP